MSEGLLHGIAAVLLFPAAWHMLRLARRMPAAPRPPSPGVPDAVAGGALALWFVVLIAQSQGRAQVVNIPSILGSATVYATLVVLTWLFLAARGISPWAFFGLRPAPAGTVWRTSLGALAASLPIIYVAQWTGSLALGQENPPQPLLDYWMNEAGLAGRVLVVVMAVVVAPVAEEILFRGYLFRVAEHFAGRWPAIATVSLLFAAVHVHLPALGGLFLLAAALNILYCVTGSLWAPIAAHAMFNAITLLVSLAWPQSL
ncbi:MAG: CPBP family intramembrane metalloprotease [Terrimicrobiaceae bacterium]|nr:CPBP family intramembrane metalloprotease [Terrimicrobiaceae bacterium]